MRVVAAVVAVVTLLGAAAAGALPAEPEPAPELVDVHHIRFAPARASGGANCENDDPTRYSGLYELTGWKVKAAKTAYLNTSTVPSGLSGVVPALQAAYDVWRGAEPNTPRITVATGGTAKRPKANRTDELMFGRVRGSIAVAYAWRYSDGHVESDVVFNKRLAWFVASAEGDGCLEDQNRYDLQNIAAHEFGHVYGLDHPSGRYETMYAYGYTGETLKRSPATGDVNGIRALY